MPTLRSIETALLQTTSRINLRPTLGDAWEAGRLLSLARPLVPHGDWIQWLKRVGVSRQTAGEYLSVHAHLDAANVRSSVHLPISHFLRAMRRAKKLAAKEVALQHVASLPEVEHVEGLHLGDSLDYLRTMPPDSIPFIITDPPFGLGLVYDGQKEPDTAASYWSWFSPFVAEMRRVLVPGGMLVICQAFRYLSNFWAWYGPDVIVTPMTFVVRGQTCWHPVVRIVKPGAAELVPHNRMDAIAVNVMETETEKLKAVHPCPMPVNVARELVFRYSLPGAVVLDPFMGLSAIGIECRRQGRVYVGVERCEEYFRIACRRLSVAPPAPLLVGLGRESENPGIKKPV